MTRPSIGTGGQYSLVRGALGLYLLVHFAHLLPWGAETFSNRGMLPDGTASPLLHAFPNVLALVDAPWAVTALLAIGVTASFLVLVGWRDRLAAVIAWYVLACLFGRNPLTSNPSLPYVGWILLCHAATPSAPFLSWSARGRIDPRGTWSRPPALFHAAWIVMAVGYSYSGLCKLSSPSWVDGSALTAVLENPLARATALRDWMLSMPDALLRVLTWGALGAELLFAPLALFARARPWLWLSLLLMHLGLIVLIDFADLSLGMVVLHLFTFNPRWVPPMRPAGQALLLYDGTCGLCHRAVRLALAEAPNDTTLRLAPLDSDAATARLGTTVDLPDSLILVTPDDRTLVRSTAVIALLDRIGGLWRVLGRALALLPRPLRDLAYDGMATIRHRLFTRPSEACPLVPSDLGERFAR